MFKSIRLALPLLLSSTLSFPFTAARVWAQDDAPAQANSGTEPESALSLPSPQSAEADAEKEDATVVGPSEFDRQDKTHAVEVFADYARFTSKREYFNPFAYGLRAYWFQNPNLKWGLSVAQEDFVFKTARRVKSGVPTALYTIEDLKRDGSAVRYAAEGQYFFQDSMNISGSIFAADGRVEKEKNYKSASYSRSGLTLSLGNQWTYEKVTLRWDWLSLTYNFAFRVGGENVLDAYPANTNGAMVVVSGLGVGASW